MAVARELDTSSAEAFGSGLLSALQHFRDGASSPDDETIIVLQRAPLDAGS